MSSIPRIDLGSPEPGAEAEGVACLVERAERKDRNGKPYAKIRVRNRTGEIGGMIWSDQLEMIREVEVGRGCQVTGTIEGGYRGGPPQIRLSHLSALPAGHPIEAEINPICPIPQEELRLRFGSLRAEIARPGMRSLVDAVLRTVGVEEFFAAPAGKMIHHAYLGGLLEHTCQVAEIGVGLAREPRWQRYVDLDVVLAGSLLHDIGKVIEYTWEGCPLQVSPKGRILSHTTWGPMLVERALADHDLIGASDLTWADAAHVMHILGSHHGEPEYGSPTRPASAEALIVHLADLCSARIQAVVETIEDHPGEHDWIDARWPRRHAIWVPGGGADRAVPKDEDDWEIFPLAPEAPRAPEHSPAPQLDEQALAYLVWLADRDIHSWPSDRRSELSRGGAERIRAELAARLPQNGDTPPAPQRSNGSDPSERSGSG